jgi:Concanavalin A-like lectin/glucanases superfamily
VPSVTFTASGSWDALASSVDLQAWGEGGNGGSGAKGTSGHSGGGGGGGAYAEEPALALTVSTSYPFTIGGGGTATNTVFAGNSVTVTAVYGQTAEGQDGVSGGAAGSNTIAYSGGSGASGTSGTGNKTGGGGGGAAGDTGNGGTATGSTGGSGNDGGGSGGSGGSGDGDNPGGAGAGGNKTNTAGDEGGGGGNGQITINYTSSISGTATLAGTGTLTAAATTFSPTDTAFRAIAPGPAWLRRFAKFRRHIPPGFSPPVTVHGAASLTGAGTLSAFGSAPAPAVVNQWSNSYGQGTTFTSITSALQSCVVPLTAAYSVGTGSGTPTAGNWLFTIATWTQDPQIINVHVGVSDDIHSWWRQYPAAGSGGYSRTSISYTPNTARVVGNVYVAPDMEIAAINVLVVEVQGLGPWDTVVGTDISYTPDGTSISLSQNAAASATFFIAAVGGDNASSGQAFLPSGWTGLATQTQSNGVNTLADNILTAAFLADSVSNQSVSGSATTAENLSGFILAVLVSGSNPIPAGWNANWPYVKFEAAFGAGFNTPNSELTWTDLSNRLWHYDETTGIQYQLGQIQATNFDIELDNFDGALSPDNTSSPYYPNIVPGTPIRMRAALGAFAGTTYNRWYVIQRNVAKWGEEITDEFRRYCPVTGTDLWAALSATPPTFYRSEVYEDNPYAWWPMDDQPLTSGVQPTVLRNAAEGNTNVLAITLSPSGASNEPFYTQSGAANNFVPGGLASYQAGTNAGWMFGDPQSEAPSLATGNSVTAEPGSASWTVQGQAGNTGGSGWYLTCTDSGFPAISTGITVEIWFNYSYYGSSSGAITSGGSGSVTASPVTAQPYNTPFTIWALGPSSSTTAALQLDASGHLNFILGGSSTAIYSGSDLRSNSWHMATVTITSSAWTVWLDGGSNAQVSGTGSPSSSWTVFTVGANQGGSGGCGNASFAHAAIYPCVLPYYRVLDHYWAAITAFGQLPAPQNPKVTWTGLPEIPQDTSYNSAPQQLYNPDGTPSFVWSGANGEIDTGTATVTPASASVIVAAAVPGAGVTSGPSAVATGTDAGLFIVEDTQYSQYFLPWYSWSGLAPQFWVYTAPGGSGQALYATVNGTGTGPEGTGDVGGSASSTPPAASEIGDTVGQRIERLLRAGRCTSPQRSIDPASLLVQAPGNQGGGIQVGAAVQAVQQSDSGLLFIDNTGNLVYWQRPHLASQYDSPVWKLGPATSSGEIPYYKEIKWITDPQYIWNVIDISPFSPTGAQLPLITPTDSTAVNASQIQYGAQPYQVQSLLQDLTEMQNQADWLFEFYGTAQRHAEQVVIEASAYPAAWELFWGINVGDIVTVEDWQIGGGGENFTFRVTEIKRRISYGSHTEEITARVELICSYEPSSYWD